MIDKDYSFIRLRDNFNDAKNLGESPYAKINYLNQIQLLTNEAYLQITNTPEGISFQADYTANLVDCSNNVLEDITDHVFIREFTDYTGLQQIEFEIINLPTDYGEDIVYLRIESNTNPDYVFWSNGFLVTEIDKEFTSRFDYRNSTIWKGTDYETTESYQSIRLKCAYTEPSDEDEIDSYYQITTGVTTATRALLKPFDKYLLENLNAWTYRRLVAMLTCDIKYIDCVWCGYSNNIELSGRIESSNLNKGELVLSKDLNKIYEVVYQIYEGLEIVDFTPETGGSYTTTSIGASLLVRFSENIELNEGKLTVYNNLGTVINEYDETDMTVIENAFEITDAFATANGSYYIKFDAGLVSNTIGISFEGITSSSTWTFTITDGEYDATEYEPSEYLT